MRSLTCFIAVGVFAVAAFPAHAATTAYAEAFDTLYKIDPVSHQATAIGPAGSYGGTLIANISGLATLSDGSLYAIWGSYNLLLKINPATGAATPIGKLNISGGTLDFGLAADSNDTLWLTSGVLKQLWTVDRNTGAATLIGATGHPIAGLAAEGTTLYGSGDTTDHGFYRIDTTSGAATPIGNFGPAAPAYLNSVAMSFDAPGTLWAVLDYVPPATGTFVSNWNDLATIDPTTGALTDLGPITGPATLQGIGMRGFTLGPAPSLAAPILADPPASTPIRSPWMLGLLGLLLAAAGLLAANRKVLRTPSPP
jgi:hypothetical protein